MTDAGDYRLANLRQKALKLESARNEVLALEPSKALERILSDRQPATLVQSFPEQDLHFLMHSVGPDDFIPVLAMASSDQWEYIVDVEAWDQDRIFLPRVTRTLELLFKADPQRLLRWMVGEKPGFLEYYLMKHIQIRIRQQDEDPSDFPDGFTSLDDVVYIRFPDLPETADLTDDEASLKADAEAAEALITDMLNLTADMDLSVCQGLLLEAGGVIAAETEEEEYRLRGIRMAEKGLVPFHEAIGIYQPAALEKIRKRAANQLDRPTVGGDLPAAPRFAAGNLRADTLFAKSLAAMSQDDDIRLNLQTELAALVNRLVAADRKEIRRKEDLTTMVDKACALLSLGLAELHGPESDCTPEAGAALIRAYSFMDIFRAGSTVVLNLRSRALSWHKESWLKARRLPLTFLGEAWLGTLGGLMVDRPVYYDGYATGVLYRPFGSLADIRSAGETLDRIMAVDRHLSILSPDLDSFTHGFLTWKSLVLTAWTKERLGLDPDLSPIRVKDFQPFFKDLMSGDGAGRIDGTRRQDFKAWLAAVAGLEWESLSVYLEPVMEALFDELEDEYGAVRPQNLDSRFVPHFLLI